MFPGWRRLILLPWVFLAPALTVSLAGPVTGVGGHEMPAPPERIALFGVDAADWRVIDRLVSAGRLPAFARLKEVASLGVLEAEPPLLSPIIWTTVATGRRPEDHGVLDFMVDRRGGGQLPVNGGARRVKALWEIWSEAGRRVQVTGWWATWPADKVRGLIASDRLATSHVVPGARAQEGLVFPSAALADVSRLIVEPGSLDYASLVKLIPLTRSEFDGALDDARGPAGTMYRDPIAHFRAAIATARTYRRVSNGLAAATRPDLWVVYYEIVDTVSHLFVADRARADRAVAAAYGEVDEALSEAARVLDPGTWLVVLSDHGFQPFDAGIREDPADFTAGATAWHRSSGIVAVTTAGALAGTSAAPRLAPLGRVTPLDIAPTVLARARLPVADDMPGRVIPALAPPTPPARVASYGGHVKPDAPAPGQAATTAELDRLRALGYVSGAGAVTSQARVNLGEILFRKGDLRGAARELEAVLRSDPANGRAALWLARTCVGLGRTEDAVRIYDRLIQAARTTSFVLDPIVVLAATELDVGEGRLDRAGSRLERLPPAATRAPEARLAVGALAEAQGRWAAAERAYREALETSPSDRDALGRLMDLLIRLKRTDEAAAVTAAGARSFPSSPEHLALAGEAALAARQFADAERSFARALALAPSARSVRLGLARSQVQGGRPAVALDTLRDADPSREAEMLRGAAFSARREWPAAIAALQRALDGGPPTTDLLNALAVAQMEAGRRDDAARSLERSLAIDPTQPAARTLLERARRK